MNIAYHFNADLIQIEHPGRLYNFPPLEKLFSSLLAINFNNLNLKIFEGDLLVSKYLHPFSEEKLNNLVNGLTGTQFRTWRDINRDRLHEVIFSSIVYVIRLEGLSNHMRDYLNHIFKTENSYLGAVQVLGVNQVQWVFYDQYLIPRYRYVNKELRIFYTMGDEENRDNGLKSVWEKLPFQAVQWEDLQARHTVFDAYETYEHSVLLIRLNEILSSRLTQLAEDVLLRIGDLNPKLQQILYAAFKTFYSAQTPEEISQVALSCRRFIEKLANTLYPPKDGLVNGRNLNAAAYRNRLWAYVEERLDVSEQVKKLVKVGLQDLGSRVDKIDELANKGLHKEISLLDLDRLLIALVTVTYDLLSLAPPPTELPIEPHLPEINKMLEELDKNRNERKT